MLFKDDRSLGFLLAQVVRLHHRRTHEMFESLNIYPGQPPILFMLWHEDGRSQKDFAEHLELKPATITVMLQRMEKAGLLERKPDAQDQRISRVYLTEKGKSIKFQVEERINKIEELCFMEFTDEEKILLRRFLLNMRENLTKSCAIS